MPAESDPDSVGFDPRPLASSPAYSDVDAVPSDPFFEPSAFKGAFDTDLWLDGYSWLADNQKLITTTVAGNITQDTTWDSSVLLVGQTEVQAGATLTIMPGVTILANEDDGNGLAPVLIVLPGAKIFAEGTARQPITFTSSATATRLPARGLWGGLIIMGNAPVHGGSRQVEGVVGYSYGGTDATESSGSLKYVRVWYGGEVIGANNEINGITLAGVGSGTTVENCEVAFNLDDGFEMFGGTVNLKWISALFCGDDAIDTDEGYQGKIQFAYVMIGSGGNHGVEMDSKGDDTPRSFPMLYQATFVHHLEGEPSSVSSDDQFDATLRLREGTGGEFGNIIVMNVPNTGVFQNECGAELRTHELPAAGGPDYLWFSSNNIIYGALNLRLFDLDNSCAGLDTAIEVDPLLTLMPAESDPGSVGFDPRPIAGSPVFDNVDSLPADDFFEPSVFKGAFNTDLWLDGYSWLADNKKLVTTAVAGNITQDTTWDSSVLLVGQTEVQAGATLTITPGVTILANEDDGNGLAPVLIVLPGAKIFAEGTATRPITFTSSVTASRLPSRGLWGGLIIMGNAPVHGGSREVEGVSGYSYGGTDATESSGSLKYVRVWYGGEVIGANNEINGITLAGVGSGTTVENCEVAFNLDDGFEMFGGTVNLKWISALFCGDDAIDTDEGYQGKIQFAYVMVGEAGNHGVEMDSKGDDTPRSFPQLYHATFVHHLRGTPQSVSSDDQFEATLRLREGTGGEFGNIIVTNIPNTGVFQNECGAENRTHELPAAGGPDYLWFSSNNIMFGAVGFSLYDLEAGCEGLTTAISGDPLLLLMPGEAEARSPGFDPRPAAGSLAYEDVDTVPDDGFFTPAEFKGAFDDTLWIKGWSWLADNFKLVTDHVEGSIERDAVWSANVLLTGQAFVEPGVTLTIMPGVNVLSNPDTDSGAATALVVLPDARLIAEGTADSPITFTSTESEATLPAPGLWGGLIIMGNAPVIGGTLEVEGIAGYTYGGSDAAESSGSLKFVRVWYGGSVVGSDNEINGITLAGVGSGTTVENCEVAFNLDDGFEMFGGTVNLKWISALFCGDDAIDTDEGYQGKIQFAYVMIGASGHHGVEMDSKADSTPRSFPQLYHATFVHHLDGAPGSVSADDQMEATLRLREGTGGEFGNIIVTNVPNTGVFQNECGAENRTHELPADGGADYLWFSSNNIVYGAANLTLYDLDATCAGLSAATNVDPMLSFVPGDADEESIVDPRPLAGGAAFENVDSVPSDDFFQPRAYKGAFEATNTWLAVWSWLAENLQLVTQTL